MVGHDKAFVEKQLHPQAITDRTSAIGGVEGKQPGLDFGKREPRYRAGEFFRKGDRLSAVGRLHDGDAFGHPTGGNFGILYPDTTLAYHTYGNQPLWPAEIWEGQLDILVFVALLFFSCFPHKKGQVFCLYVFLYSLERFCLEFLRGDYVSLTMGLKSAQMTSVIAMAIAAAIFIFLHFKGTTDKEDIAQKE